MKDVLIAVYVSHNRIFNDELYMSVFVFPIFIGWLIECWLASREQYFRDIHDEN
jgi:hypothetical protein